MPINIIGGYPCRICGRRSVEVQTEREYYWVEFGVVLKEEITNYICPKLQEHTHPGYKS